MHRSYRWQGIATRPRVVLINDLKNFIATAGGAIVNNQQFSDLNLGLTIEIPEYRLSNLYQNLGKALQMEEFDVTEVNHRGNNEVVLFLSITFAEGTGDLRNEIPSVPG